MSGKLLILAHVFDSHRLLDKVGIAIILCDTDQERKYNLLTDGKTQLESALHHNLTEHINSEIGLSTITNLETAQAWLRRSFLYRRIQKNPNHYGICKEDNQTWQSRLDRLVEESVEKLTSTGLLNDPKDVGLFECTEYGHIMSKVCKALAELLRRY